MCDGKGERRKAFPFFLWVKCRTPGGEPPPARRKSLSKTATMDNPYGENHRFFLFVVQN